MLSCRVNSVGLLASRALLVSLLITSSGAAQSAESKSAGGRSAEDKAAADALFDAAREAMDAGDYLAACPKFADSQRLDPGVGTLLNLARCYDLSGRTSSAYSTYREAAALARDEGQADREEFARQEVTRLEGNLTRLVVVVAEAQVQLDGLRIERAGKVIPRTMWGVPMPVDPGVHEIEVSAPGYVSARASIEARGAGKTIELTVPSMQPEAVPAAGAGVPEVLEGQQQGQAAVEEGAQPASTTPGDSGARGGAGVVPWILGGVGLAAVGVGTGFAVMGLQKNDEAKEICVDVAVCPGDQIDAWWEARDGAQTNYAVAYVAWGVGAAALVSSVVWLALGQQTKHARAVRLTPVATERELGLLVGGTF